MLVQPLLLCFIIIVFWKIPKGIKTKKIDGIGGPEAAGEGQFGTARFLSEKEIDNVNTAWMYEKQSKPPKAGLLIGMDKVKKKAWIVGDDTHTLLIGATRSYKTSNIVKPSIWEIGKSGESMIITDPKGELYNDTHGYLREQGV